VHRKPYRDFTGRGPGNLEAVSEAVATTFYFARRFVRSRSRWNLYRAGS
jgi:hypothetical protein